jgi:sulfate permease, SulP family
VSNAASRSPVVSRWLPALGWLRMYDRTGLRVDVVAGITLAAYLLPAGLGDASLANLPPQAGLYACLFGGLVFWLFCSSRHTTITVTSAISLLVGASLGGIAVGDTTRFGALAAGTAVLVALIAFIAWLCKAGSIVNFIFGERHDRLQVWCSAVSRQYPVAEAVWHPRRSRKFLGKQRQPPEASVRN